MQVHGLIAWLAVGALAGWISGLLVKGGGFGLIGDIVVGIIGAVLGGWIAGMVGLQLGGGFLGSLITATAGAVLLLLVVRLVRRG